MGRFGGMDQFMLNNLTGGRVIFLNGTSSSGKGSIAAALLEILPGAYVHIGYDDLFGLRRSDAFFGADGFRLRVQDHDSAEPIAMEINPLAAHYFAGMHRAVAAFAAAGNNLIVDWVLWDEAWLRDFVALLRNQDVLFVGVRCPLPEVEKRERERGDRMVGLARSQFAHVHAHARYDLEVDTSVATPTECAEQIAAFLAERQPIAFRRLNNA